MPSPVAHTLAGVVAFELLHPRAEDRVTHKSWQLLLPWIILPSLPDIDYFLSYLLYNDPRVLHGGITHTLGFAILFSLFLVPWKIFGSSLATFGIAFVFACLTFVAGYGYRENDRPFKRRRGHALFSFF